MHPAPRPLPHSVAFLPLCSEVPNFAAKIQQRGKSTSLHDCQSPHRPFLGWEQQGLHSIPEGRALTGLSQTHQPQGRVRRERLCSRCCPWHQAPPCQQLSITISVIPFGHSLAGIKGPSLGHHLQNKQEFTAKAEVWKKTWGRCH